MARPLRLHVPRTLYHVTSRGNDRRPIFSDDDDHLKYLDLLARGLERFGIRCSAYCLMWNHVHLLLRPADYSISRLMHQVGSTYAQWLNRRHGHTGHVLQGRFDSRLVDNSVYYLRVLRYIVRNPVAANYVPVPEQWRWSSYRATAGFSAAPAFLDTRDVWRAFDRRSKLRAQEQFREFVTSAADDDERSAGLLVGSPAFAQAMEPELRPHRTVGEFTYAHRFASRPPLASLFEGLPPGPEVDLAARQAFLAHAYTLREIGELLGRPPGTVWMWIKRAGQTPRKATAPIFE